MNGDIRVPVVSTKGKRGYGTLGPLWACLTGEKLLITAKYQIQLPRPSNLLSNMYTIGEILVHNITVHTV